MKYAVVVVTYNRITLLKECLEHILMQEEQFDEVVIVNNCSTDGTTEFLNDYTKDYSMINLINTKENLGGAGGFKIGVENVSSDMDFFLLIDDDAILNYDFLKKIKENYSEDYLAYSGTVKTDEIIDTSHRRYLVDRVFMKKEDVSIDKYEENTFSYDLSTFCGLIVSNKLVSKIGLPKAEYFIWYDDTEYSLRLSQYTKILNVNAAIINHKTVINNDQNLSWKSYYGYRNQIDVGKRYSKMPRLYLLYRYTYHRFRTIELWFRGLKGNEYYRNCSQLHRQVIKDSKKGVLGLSNNYLPGRKL